MILSLAGGKIISPTLYRGKVTDGAKQTDFQVYVTITDLGKNAGVYAPSAGFFSGGGGNIGGANDSMGGQNTTIDFARVIDGVESCGFWNMRLQRQGGNVKQGELLGYVDDALRFSLFFQDPEGKGSYDALVISAKRYNLLTYGPGMGLGAGLLLLGSYLKKKK